MVHSGYEKAKSVQIDIYFDGSCKNVKGESSPMGLGVAVFAEGEFIEEYSKSIFRWERGERCSNNVSEWMACVEAMKIAYAIRTKIPEAKIRVYSDSQLITRQYNGEYTVSDNFRSYYQEARKYGLLAYVRMISWIPREQNKMADKLAGEGRRKDVERFEQFQQSQKQKV